MGALKKEIDLEDPTPNCKPSLLWMHTEREARVNLQAVQSNDELSKSLTTAANIDEKIRRKVNLVGKTTDWSFDMQESAEKCVEKYIFRISKENRVVSPAGATLCIDNNSLPSEDFESRGKLLDALAQIVLKNSMWP